MEFELEPFNECLAEEDGIDNICCPAMPYWISRQQFPSSPIARSRSRLGLDAGYEAINEAGNNWSLNSPREEFLSTKFPVEEQVQEPEIMIKQESIDIPAVSIPITIPPIVHDDLVSSIKQEFPMLVEPKKKGKGRGKGKKKNKKIKKMKSSGYYRIVSYSKIGYTYLKKKQNSVRNFDVYTVQKSNNSETDTVISSQSFYGNSNANRIIKRLKQHYPNRTDLFIELPSPFSRTGQPQGLLLTEGLRLALAEDPETDREALLSHINRIDNGTDIGIKSIFYNQILPGINKEIPLNMINL